MFFMKIAITAKGTDLDSEVDSMFGNTTYTLIVDTFSLGVQVMNYSMYENESINTEKQTAALISDKRAGVLLTGFCSPDVFKSLNAAGVKVANDITGTVRDAVTAFVEGRVSFVDPVYK
jgi:predicted Fe-Mo cluster-binding NifX family protein